MWETIALEEEPGLERATDFALDAFEARYKVRLPIDQRVFLKTFGQGVLFNHFRIFGLDKINEEIEEYQDRWESYFFWDGAGSELTQEEIGNCVVIGDTFNSDELVLSPAHVGKIFFLPADEDVSLNLGDSLEGAIETLVEKLRAEIASYPDEEREQWDLRPVFNRASF